MTPARARRRVLLAGALLTRDGFVDGWADVEGALVRAAGRGDPPRAPDARGVVVPAPVNAHTHVGDRALRGRLDPSLGLAALFEPPKGLKHKLLKETPEPILLHFMREALRELTAAGARLAVDFREGGLEGARLLREASRAERVPVRVLGRAQPGEDVGKLLEVADGVGIPAIGNLPPGEAERWAREARRRGKLVALHASEGAREPVGPILDLRPHHVVHMTQAGRGDFLSLASRDLLVVVCPRSNATLVRRLPDVRTMLEVGCRVALGTDNASMQPLDVLGEAAFLARDCRLSAAQALAVTFFGWSEPGEEPPAGVVEGARGPFLVLRGEGGPEEVVLSGRAEVVARTG